MAKFNLLSYILPPEEKIFYTLFEESAQVCNDVAKAYKDIVTTSLTEDHVINVKGLKHKSNDLLKETLHQLNVTLITPIDREDIQHITNGMHKINRRICRACVNIKLFQIQKFDERIVKQAEILSEAIGGLKQMVDMLKKHTKVSEFVSLREQIDEVESKGDEIFSNVIEDLFSGRYDAIDVIKLRDIHNNIETALNTSVIVAEDVVQIVLKHN